MRILFMGTPDIAAECLKAHAWPKPEKKKTDPVKKPLNCCNSSAACRVSENTA